ncbi:MAG: hypothetical protein PHU06_08310 [Gallionella sp.]|nr:hypothetical protein [Gallionella sp.]MDD4958969.1 hypothetical protein [Gallionella sp.]
MKEGIGLMLMGLCALLLGFINDLFQIDLVLLCIFLVAFTTYLHHQHQGGSTYRVVPLTIFYLWARLHLPSKPPLVAELFSLFGCALFFYGLYYFLQRKQAS